MIRVELSYLCEILMDINPDYLHYLDIKGMLTIAIETLHSVSHFKDQTQTMLQHAQNLGNTVHGGLKHVVNWCTYYFTQELSYYPIPEHAMTLIDVTGNTVLLPYLKPIRLQIHLQMLHMLDWVNDTGELRQF